MSSPDHENKGSPQPPDPSGADVTTLDLYDASNVDERLAALGSLTHCTSIYLDESDVTDVGLAHLCELPSLTSCRLTYTSISGDGLRHWRAPQLKELHAGNCTHLTTTFFEKLRDFPALDWLWLKHVPLRDEHMPLLRPLVRLRLLFIDGTQVTDAGLAHLDCLQNLTVLTADKTQISDAAFERLRSKLPNLVRRGGLIM
jgi:internalin A